jgi:hypothetical protein
MFKDKVVINLDLDIHWQDSSGLEEVVLDVKMNSHRIKGDSAQQARISAELDDLLCRLYHDASSLLVKPLKSGYSGARVLLVQPFYDDRGGGRADVVKFGHVRKIDQEYHNFTQYVRPFVGGGRQTEVRGLRRTMQLGGIVYTLLGTASDQLQEFDSYYRQADLDQIKQTLNHLFQDTCASWYANRGQLQPLDLTEEYQRALKFSPAELEPVLTEGLPLVQGKETLHFKALSGDRSFKNPILAAAKQHFVRSTYACITHGDLNQRNIMVDQAGHTWLIDFQYTEPSHILRDIVRLDSVVRIQLLSPEEATLSERLEMEETLCRIERFREVEFLPNSFQTENRALAKAYATAVHLRMLARKVIGHNPNDDFSEFHIASFYQALKMLQFHAMPMAQCEHALLSASLLAERLGL